MFQAGEELEEYEPVESGAVPAFQDLWAAFDDEPRLDPTMYNLDMCDDFMIQRMESADLAFHEAPRRPKIIGTFLMGQRIGDGAYCKVKEALDLSTLRRVAVKIMQHRRLRKIPNGGANVKKEIRLLSRLRHPNVIELVDTIYNHQKKKIYVFMELCTANLQELLAAAPSKRLPGWQAQLYFRQLAEAMSYIHGQGIAHRDIKPGNLLITNDDVLKLSDFGVADEFDRFSGSDECTSSSGTPAFQPAELANGADSFQGFKVDVWAAGVSLWNMLTGSYPFDGDSIYSLYAAIGSGKFVIPDGVTDPAALLLRSMLDLDVENRYSVHQVQQSEWVKSTLPRSANEPKVPFPPTGAEYHASTVISVLSTIYREDAPEERDVGTASSTQQGQHLSTAASAGVTSPNPVRAFFTKLFSVEDKD